MSKFGSASSTILWVAVLWLVVAGILALEFWPAVPQSASGWVAFILFGPPLYALGEAVSEAIRSSRVGRYVSNHPLRMVFGVLVGSAWVAFMVVLFWNNQNY